jgi:outer membrane receptor protein involved in Fe transport
VFVPDYVLPAYTVVNLNAGMQFKSVSIEAYVRNVFNEAGQTSAASGYTPLGGPVHVTLEEPRTAGVNVRFSF